MHVKSHVCQPDGYSRSHRGFPYATFAHQHNQAVFTASDILDRPESDKFSGMYRAFVAGSGNASEWISSSPFNAETPTILTGCSNRVSVGSSDKPAGRFASASCSRCHIAAAGVIFSFGFRQHTINHRYWFSGQLQPVLHGCGRLPAASILQSCNQNRRVRSGSDNASTA